MSIVDTGAKVLSVLELLFALCLIGVLWVRSSVYAWGFYTLILVEFRAWLRRAPLRDWRLWFLVIPLVNLAMQWTTGWLKDVLFSIWAISMIAYGIAMYRAFRALKARSHD